MWGPGFCALGGVWLTAGLSGWQASVWDLVQLGGGTEQSATFSKA